MATTVTGRLTVLILDGGTHARRELGQGCTEASPAKIARSIQHHLTAMFTASCTQAMPTDRPLALITAATTPHAISQAHILALEYDLVLAGQGERLKSLAEDVEARGGRAQAVVADIGTERGVAAVRAALRGAGRVPRLAAVNAQIGSGKPFVEDDLEAALDQLRLALHFAELTARDMASGAGGRVVLSTFSGDRAREPSALSAAATSFAREWAAGLADDLTGSPVELVTTELE